MTPPTPADRNRNADLKALSLVVVKDRLSNGSRFNEHVVETTDLLVPCVEAAIGVNFRINWSEVTDEELPAIKAWQDYCLGLFDSVQEFVLAAVSR
jgi:hypothetical protein